MAKKGMQIFASIDSSIALSLLSKEVPSRRLGSRGTCMGFEFSGNTSLNNFCAPGGETINAQVPNILCSLKVDTFACE